MSCNQGETFYKCISFHLSLLSTDLPGKGPGLMLSGYFWVFRTGLITDVIVIPLWFHAHLTWLRRNEKRRYRNMLGLVPGTRHWVGPTVWRSNWHINFFVMRALPNQARCHLLSHLG